MTGGPRSDQPGPVWAVSVRCSPGDAAPTLASLLTHAYRNGSRLFLVDVIALGLLAIATPRPMLSASGPSMAAPLLSIGIGILILGTLSAHWAATHRATGETQVGFAMLTTGAVLAGVVGYLIVWSLVGAPPGESWMDSFAPQVSTTADPVSDVTIVAFLMLFGANLAWIAFIKSRGRTGA